MIDDAANLGPSHSPQGECGLKLDDPREPFAPACVTPRKGSVD